MDISDTDLDFTTPRGINKLMDQCTAILRDRGNDTGGYEKNLIPKPPASKPGGNAMRCLESMLKQILSAITTAQERRGRRDLEESEKYIKSLEDQIELLQKQPPSTVCDTSGLTSEEVTSLKCVRAMDRWVAMWFVVRKTCDELREKLEQYQKETSELKLRLEQEQKEKEELAKQIDTIQGEAQNLDMIRYKYKAVQQENSKLYNMVQDLRGNIRVFCRVRPVGLTGDSTRRAVTTDSEDGRSTLTQGIPLRTPWLFRQSFCRLRLER